MFVYITEAHAQDTWPLGTDVKSQHTIEEREAVARRFIQKAKLGYTRCFIDTFGDTSLDHLYSAWPDKTVLIRDGIVAFDAERWTDSDWVPPLDAFLSTGTIPFPRQDHSRLVVDPARPPVEREE